MKSILNLVFVAVTLLALLTISACSSNPTSSHTPPESTVGGWVTVEDGTITDQLHGYFDKAIEGLTGCKYEAVQLVAKQVVAGRNYKFLCNVTPLTPNATTSQKYIIVYVDLEGNCSVTDILDID